MTAPVGGMQLNIKLTNPGLIPGQPFRKIIIAKPPVYCAWPSYQSIT